MDISLPRDPGPERRPTGHLAERARTQSSKRARTLRGPSEDRRIPVSKSSSHISRGSDQSQGPSGLSYFDPASLVKNREGTFKPPKAMEHYLGKHLRRCLTKEEREALFKEHPLPDIDACIPPRIDKYVSEFLGKRFPKDQDTRLNRVQSAVLAVTRPLVSAWQGLLESGMDEDPEMSVPAVEVLSLCQRTLCLVGNASELISQERRSSILGAIDPSWTKYGTDPYPKSGRSLFGDDLKSALADKVEGDTALSKAVALTRKGKSYSQSGAPPPFPRRGRQHTTQFFPRGPPAGYGSRQGRNMYHTHRESPYSRNAFPGGRRPHQIPQNQRFGQRPQFHEPRLPTDTPQLQRPLPKR